MQVLLYHYDFRGLDNYNLLYYLNTTCTTESLSCFGIVTIAALTRFVEYNTSLATLQILRCSVFHTRTLTLLQRIRAKEHLCKINNTEPTSVSTEVDNASALSSVLTMVVFLPTRPPVFLIIRRFGAVVLSPF